MYLIKTYDCFHRLRFCLVQMITVSVIVCFSLQMGVSQNGLWAEYFDGKDFDRFVSAAYVDNINDAWYDVPPVSGIDPHNCSIRWTGKLRPSKTETYLFSALVDDGIRVWIDNKLIIDQWGLNDVGVFNGKIELIADTDYNLKVEYFNALLEGEIKLLWDIEKAKEEQSWYESIFGVEYAYSVIKSYYFFIPDRTVTKINAAEEKVPVDRIKKVNKNRRVSVRKETAVAVTPVQQVIDDPATKNIIKPSTIEIKEEIVKSAQKPQDIVEIMTVELAQKFIPKNVQFERAKVDILPASITELNTFVKFLLENPNVEVTIQGHTETVGNATENQKLSEKRAIRVSRYFIQEGISVSRLSTVGFGGSRPLKIPMKGEYYPQNRRVVFMLRGLE